MTCKDCYHYEACFSGGESVWNNIEQAKGDHCRLYKDKSRIVELPIKATDELRAELTEYCHNRCIDEL